MTLQAENISLYKVNVDSNAPVVENIPAALDEALKQIKKSKRFSELKAGASIAITAGSRGIANYPVILQYVVQSLQDDGYKPFLFAAMGSHGRGEAAGQQEILDSLGITESKMNCQVACSDSVVVVDEIEAFDLRIPVHCAKEAWEADGIIVINRIKPHTSFHGKHESGLLKMMTVGLGRAKGAAAFHSLGANRLAEAIERIGGAIIEKASILGGIAILENAHEETAHIQGIAHEELPRKEQELLIKAKELMPRLPIEKADLCIVREMGKNYSGTGMDTNVIGRLRIQGSSEPENPYFTYIGVLRLSEESHGNATGIGLADFTTQQLADAMDKKATYLNCLTTGFVIRAAVPLTLNTDRELLQASLQALKVREEGQLRMVAISNTLHINTVWVTEAIWQEIKDEQHIRLVSGPTKIEFDEQGNWIWS